MKPEALQSYLTDYFDGKCPKSKALYEEAKKAIPGAVQHNQAFSFPFPLAFNKAGGAHLEDVDGNQYIDFLQGGGSTLLGTNPPVVLEKVKELLDECGPVTCLFHEYELKLARFIIDRYPGIDMVRLLGSGTAAVVIEPLGPESGTRPLDYDYCQKVRELCDKYDALLIFDEVVTGFRTAMGGAQEYFGVTPDLTVLGKVIAGGYPAAGALGGKREYMERLAGGIGGKKGKKAHVGGTLAANPLSSLAGYYTLVELEKTNGVEKAGRLGDRLTRGLRNLIKKYKLPYVAYNQGSMVHIETTGPILFDINILKFWQLPGKIKEIYRRKDVMVNIGAAFMAEGLVTVGGSRMFTNAAFTEEIVDDALLRFERVFKNVEGV